MKIKNKEKNKEENLVFRNIKFCFKKILGMNKTLFYLFFATTLASGLLPFIEVIIPKLLIDELTNYRRVNYLIIVLLLFFVVTSILKFLSSFLSNLGQGEMLEVRMEFMNEVQRKILSTDYKNTEDKNYLNKIENIFDKCFGSDGRGLGLILTKSFELSGSLIAFIGYSGIILTLNPLILGYLVINVLIIYYLIDKAKKYEYSKKNEISENDRKEHYLYSLTSDFSYGKDIRVFNLKEFLKEKYSLTLKEGIKITNDIKNKNLKTSLVSVLLLLIREGIAYGYLVYSVLYKDMSIGNFTLYFATIASFASIMEGILNCITDIGTHSLYLTEYVEFIVEREQEEKAQKIKIPKDKTYEIEFRNVSFKYPNSERYIMKNLSLKIEKGQRLAIVGVNGAGKTTFIKLLTSLYKPTEGEILLNGININSFKQREYFDILSVVFQDVNIFPFDVSKNIALIDEKEIDKERVEKSLDESGMLEKIKSLKNGTESVLCKVVDDDGVELSGGQNQRLALARALYKDAEIVILDEPTSALDAIAEYNIYTKFNDMIGEKTAIYISHRLSSTKFCDVIAFFEDGEIKEFGSHEELLNKNGRYAEMFEVQSSYYKQNEEGDLIAN